ncbi:MAG: hypothetical protein GX855_04235 [Firmicutes bacterium]|nr:hypothetical protein [Bacillota bacterium]
MPEYREVNEIARDIALDATLLEVGNREIWQLELVSRDQVSCGRVVRQLVEPQMYTIRYLIVYDAATGRRVPVPANAVTEITNEAVFCSIEATKLFSLPTLTQPLNRAQEEEIYGIIDQTPYWIEEAALIQEGQEPDMFD